MSLMEKEKSPCVQQAVAQYILDYRQLFIDRTITELRENYATYGLAFTQDCIDSIINDIDRCMDPKTCYNHSPIIQFNNYSLEQEIESIRNCSSETMMVLKYTPSGKLVTNDTLKTGDVNSISLSHKDLFDYLLDEKNKDDCYRYVFIHNHPYCINASLSESDRVSPYTIQLVGKATFRYSLEDYFVVTPFDCWSFTQENLNNPNHGLLESDLLSEIEKVDLSLFLYLKSANKKRKY